MAHDLLGCARCHDLPAVLSGPRAKVDDPVGGSHRRLVVLYDQQCVAQVAHLEQRLDQAEVVALVQADRGLVEHVQHAHQPRADLCRQADALCLAARQRRRLAVERQVIQPHVDQESQSIAHFLEDTIADQQFSLRQRADLAWVARSRTVARLGPEIGRAGQILDPLQEFRHRQGSDLVESHPGDGHRHALCLEPPAVADRARTGAHVLAEAGAFVIR